MTHSALTDQIAEKINTVTSMPVYKGYLEARPGIYLVPITTSPQRTFYDRSEDRAFAFTAHIKSDDQKEALDTAQAIGDALTRWTPEASEDYRLLTIQHRGPFFIHREPSTNYYIYGVEIDALVHY